MTPKVVHEFIGSPFKDGEWKPATIDGKHIEVCLVYASRYRRSFAHVRWPVNYTTKDRSIQMRGYKEYRETVKGQWVEVA
jgi:hypothetical protein